MKFRQGLQVNIQSQIATIPYGRPTNTDPEGWYCAAQRIDQVQLTNETFQSSQCLVPTLSSRIPTSCLSPLSMVYPPVFSMPVPPKPSPSPLSLSQSLGVSIDIDVTQKSRPLPPCSCYCYRETGHLVRDCPYWLDVWQLTAEKRKELIKDLIALKDIAVTEEAETPSKEDFL